jgi:hypothetical protein
MARYISAEVQPGGAWEEAAEARQQAEKIRSNVFLIP